MAGAIAACAYPIPEEMAEKRYEILTEDLRQILNKFERGKWKGEK
jgi:hypothetical protein